MPRRRAGAVSALGLILISGLSGCGKNEQSSIQSARSHLQRHEFNAAAIELKNALQANPASAEARFLLGSAMLDSRDPSGAAFQFQKASDLGYAAPELATKQARALLQSGDKKKLVEKFSTVRLPVPQLDAELRTSVATAYASLEKPADAKAALTDALHQVAGYVPARLVQGRMAAAAGDVTEGMRVVDSVLHDAPDNAEAYSLRGDLLLRRDGQFSDEAIAAFEKAVSIDPALVPAQATLTLGWLAKNDLMRAAKQVDAMKVRFPRDSRTLFLQAQLAYQQGSYTAAAELSNRLLKLAPTQPRYLTLAGASELQLRSFEQSETHLQQALQAAPESASSRQLLAQLYLRRGQPDHAMEVIEPLLGTPNPDAVALAAAGQASLQRGRYDLAETYFSRASKQSPADTPIKTALALTRLSKGETDLAFTELAGIAATDPMSSADLALISARIQRKEYEKALQAIDLLAQKQPGNAQAPHLRGQVQLALAETDAARSSFEQALKVEPTYFPAAASLVFLDLQANRPNEATERVQNFLKQDPKNLRALMALAELRQRAGAPPAEVQQLLEKAIDLNPSDGTPRVALIDHYLGLKDAKLAISTAQAAIAALPENTQVLDALGRAQWSSGETNQALATYGKLAALQPKSPLPLLRMADIQLASKNNDDAAQSLRRALGVSPDLLAAQQGLIAIETAAGRQAVALDIARKVQAQRPRDSTGSMLEGDIESSRKNWTAAATAFRAGFGKRGDERNAVKLHTLLLGTGRKPESEQFAHDWMRDHPRDAFFAAHLGEQAFRDKDLPGAERFFRQVLALSPGNAAAHNNLGWALAQQRKPGAVAEAEKANQLSPDQPAILETLALALSEDNQLKRAIEVQAKAAALAPQLPMLRLDLARLYLKAGEKTLAKERLDELARLGTSFAAQAQVAELQQKL